LRVERTANQAVDETHKLRDTVDNLSADLEKKMEEAKSLAFAKDNKFNCLCLY